RSLRLNTADSGRIGRGRQRPLMPTPLCGTAPRSAAGRPRRGQVAAEPRPSATRAWKSRPGPALACRPVSGPCPTERMASWRNRAAPGPGGRVPVAETDRRGVSLVFVDVLFAAVATKILEQSSRGGLPFEGKTQLALAAVLTITAWIAYHNSTNRAAYM